MTVPEFSFKYGGVPFGELKKETVSRGDNTAYVLEDGLNVILKSKKYEEFDACEWVLSFEFKGEGRSKTISEINDCDINVKLPEYVREFLGDRFTESAPKIIKMKGCVEGINYRCDDEASAAEFSFHTDYIWNEGQKLEYANIGGWSSNYFMPFFDVNQDLRGAIIAIGWTGSWKAEFTKLKEGINVKTGLQNAEFYLNSGEKVRTTSVLVMNYAEGEDKSNKFRRLIKEHFSCSTRRNRKKNYLLANELWGGISSDEMVKRINEYKEYGISFEQEWIDAGWYGDSKKCDDAFTGDWGAFTGDWYMNPRIHKDNMTDVKKACEDAGMRMMVWIEPERIVRGTECSRNHPEFLIHAKDKNTGELSPYLLLNLGDEAGFNYVFDTLCGYIDLLHLECLRQDFNFEPDIYWETNDEKGRKGITEIKHITGLYKLWDKLLEKYPELLIDDCASGGRRIDIETIRRAIPFFRSDYQCDFNAEPDVTQTHGTNISRYLPYTGCTTKTKADTYAARSTYASSWGGAFYNAVFQTMSESDLKWAKKTVDEYKEIRKYFSCDFYNHGTETFDKAAWTVWQYDDSGKEGIIIAFRREKSPHCEANISLKGIKKDFTYEFTNTDSGEVFTISGEKLFEDGFTIRLNEKYSSVIIKYSAK